MLLDQAKRSPLKAIDFGLALPFKDKELPLTDAELQGTPWYEVDPWLLCNTVVHLYKQTFQA